ncbi:MAG TPA: CDP-alcohol phosphatidyltransferase family protein [Thermoanaerobaculia bacterium]|nr:CDP-alcohol phosphatidyltransferase family protein [Thermoanaerobaculia bacterium]
MNPWRDRLNRWLLPIAQRTPLSPNEITLLALAINLGGAFCLAMGGRRPPLFLVAIALIAIGGLADALDGIVARAKNLSSRYGDFLDHAADRVSDTAVAACWLYGNGVAEWLTIATIILVMLNGYLGTQIEATWRERSYEAVGRGEFVLALIVFPIVSYIAFTNGWAALRFASFTIAEWLALLMSAFALLGVVQRLALARRLERTP